MRNSWMVLMVVLTALMTGFTGCTPTDPLVEVKKLESENKIREAREVYAKYVESSGDQKISRDYIKFLLRNNQLHFFRDQVRDHLRRFPNDTEVKNLEYEHYVDLATSAEKRGDFSDAIDYITNHLLSPDFRDYKIWEGRICNILLKWYESGKKSDNQNLMKKVLLDMENLGCAPLAATLREQDGLQK